MSDADERFPDATPVHRVYVDGFYNASPLTTDFDLLNVTNIQVLKGPQGTLFGRNSAGGAISIVTNDPDGQHTASGLVRVGTPQGMVTLRREADRVVFVTWGNAEAPMRQAWNALAWAYAEAGGGQVDTPGGPVDAATFRQEAELPPALGPGGA